MRYVCPKCGMPTLDYEPLRRRYVCLGSDCSWSGTNPGDDSQEKERPVYNFSETMLKRSQAQVQTP